MVFSSEGKSSDVAVQGFQLITLINQFDKNSEHTHVHSLRCMCINAKKKKKQELSKSIDKYIPESPFLT